MSIEFRGRCICQAILLTGLLLSCSGELSDPQKIVDKAITIHGGDRYLNCTVEFDFRKRHYIARREGGNFSYERIFSDSTSTTHDYLTNTGFVREINDQKQDLPDSMVTRYTASVNSVLYFALLPYGLNDPAVNKKLMGNTMLESQPYYIIEVTFGQQGGGEDFEDKFYYWIHKKNFTVDYLAYSFEENKTRDIRFRKVLKRQVVGGITFQDYINYKPKEPGKKLEEAQSLFESGQLEELSRIELENVVVK
ncbi:MAG: hypothetical protein K2U26_12765 [Cyclobacteriaceae bacterium]|nr:hypothetical protein [Cyclobacteriaceae bacterium]